MTTRVLSIDVGLKNLAVCIVEVQKVDPVKLSYRSALLKRKVVNILFQQLYTISGNLDRSLKSHLKKVQSLQHFSGCQYIIVQQQMKISSIMSSIMNKIIYHFTDDYKTCLRVSPHLKCRIFFDESLKRDHFTNLASNYANNKKHTIQNYKYYKKYTTRKGKLDDLADAFMMGVAFVINGCDPNFIRGKINLKSQAVVGKKASPATIEDIDIDCDLIKSGHGHIEYRHGASTDSHIVGVVHNGPMSQLQDESSDCPESPEYKHNSQKKKECNINVLRRPQIKIRRVASKGIGSVSQD